MFLFTILILGLFGWFFLSEMGAIIDGGFETFIGRILAYLFVLMMLGVIFGWQIRKICYNIYIVY